MMWLVDPTKPQPLFEQLAASVRAAIAQGEIARGERLPAASDVAGMLEVNMHTVLKAYQVLRDEGLIELRRGRGAVVTASHAGEARLLMMARELLEESRRHGIDAAEVARRIHEGEWS